MAYGSLRAGSKNPVNPPHRLALAREQQDGAVVDDDLDQRPGRARCVARRTGSVARLGVAGGTAEVEEVTVE